MPEIVAPSLDFMSVNHVFFHAALFCCIFSFGWTAPGTQNYSRNSRPSSPSKDENLQLVLRDFKTELSDVKHLLNNHESEIEIVQRNLTTQENALDDLQKTMLDELGAQKELVRASGLNVDSRFDELELSIKNSEPLLRNALADLRKLSAQGNDTVATVSQHQKRISDLEKAGERQEEHIQHLEAALHSLLDLIQAQESKTPQKSHKDGNEKTYKVQAGDSLEKIARLHGTSLSSVRKANPQLSDDRIRVGQTINIP